MIIIIHQILLLSSYDCILKSKFKYFRFALKGTLPYESELLEKQTGLLRYVLEQPYSRDMVCGMLGLQKQHKQHCAALEDQLVELIVLALERSENAAEGDDSATQGLWLHLSSQLIYFVLFQFASFPNIVMALHSRLQGKEVRRSRDQLMWVLLQFISGSIQRNPLSNFLPVLRLYELLFPEQVSRCFFFYGFTLVYDFTLQIQFLYRRKIKT